LSTKAYDNLIPNSCLAHSQIFWPSKYFWRALFHAPCHLCSQTTYIRFPEYNASKYTKQNEPENQLK
jgi:hypothetical protein